MNTDKEARMQAARDYVPGTMIHPSDPSNGVCGFGREEYMAVKKERELAEREKAEDETVPTHWHLLSGIAGYMPDMSEFCETEVDCVSDREEFVDRFYGDEHEPIVFPDDESPTATWSVYETQEDAESPYHLPTRVQIVECNDQTCGYAEYLRDPYNYVSQ